MSRRYQKPRDKNTAAFLALTLGWAGIHKIYLRQPSVTFFMVFLLMMTRFYIFPFLLFAGIFEAFRLFGMSENEVIKFLGEPDDKGGGSNRYRDNIWRYGDL